MKKFDDFTNMPCDYSGFCTGTSCPIFFECQGAVKKSSCNENGNDVITKKVTNVAVNPAYDYEAGIDY